MVETFATIFVERCEAFKDKWNYIDLTVIVSSTIDYIFMLSGIAAGDAVALLRFLLLGSTWTGLWKWAVTPQGPGEGTGAGGGMRGRPPTKYPVGETACWEPWRYRYLLCMYAVPCVYRYGRA